MPIIHQLTEFYQEIYHLAKKLSKRDRFGIHNKIEKQLLEALGLAIDASLESPETKRPVIQKLRRVVEIIKHLVRTEEELKIIEPDTYWQLQKKLQEISKMACGWFNYTKQKP